MTDSKVGTTFYELTDSCSVHVTNWWFRFASTIAKKKEIKLASMGVEVKNEKRSTHLPAFVPLGDTPIRRPRHDNLEIFIVNNHESDVPLTLLLALDDGGTALQKGLNVV